MISQRTNLLSSNLDISDLHIHRNYSISSNSYSPHFTNDYDFCLFSSLINDKTFQLYNEKHEYVRKCHQRAQTLIRLDTKVFNGQDATTQEIWIGQIESMLAAIKVFTNYSKALPGFSNILHSDFPRMLKKRIYDYNVLKNASLFIDGEYYWCLPNGIHYSRNIMKRMVGEALTDAIFGFQRDLDDLRLTAKELALMIPLMLSKPGLYNSF